MIFDVKIRKNWPARHPTNKGLNIKKAYAEVIYHPPILGWLKFISLLHPEEYVSISIGNCPSTDVILGNTS